MADADSLNPLILVFFLKNYWNLKNFMADAIPSILHLIK